MKDLISERLKHLASAQECMMSVADIMEHWENRQSALEQRTFDIINISDTVLNLSKAGCKLDDRLSELHREISHNLSGTNEMTTIIVEAEEMFHKIWDASSTASELSHNLEQEVASQREMIESLKASLNEICHNVNSTVACTDMLLSEHDTQ